MRCVMYVDSDVNVQRESYSFVWNIDAYKAFWERIALLKGATDTANADAKGVPWC